MTTNQRMLKFTTCGHVDDGKSTLIGRLLYELGVIPEDQASGAMVNGTLDYSRLTDGLEDERTQGITIDVAYRYFEIAGQHYRFADSPGHIQYLRNMAVAAVDSDAVLVLVDALHGVREQTLRHSQIAAFFGVKRLVVVVNKMDLVEFARGRFEEICAQFRDGMRGAADLQIDFIPVSALAGDNVSTRSARTLWYQGPTLREWVTQFALPAEATGPARLPVQGVVRITDTQRGYQGTLVGSSLRVGDVLHVADTGAKVTVHALYHSGAQVPQVNAGDAITVVVAEDVDVARGSFLCAANAPANRTDNFFADVFWMSNQEEGKAAFQGMLKLGHREEMAEIVVDSYRGPIGAAEVFTANPVVFDSFATQPRMGLFLLIEPETERVAGIGKALHAKAAPQEIFAI